ncbi:hypothetical protein [Maritalea sp.]|uniref:hypothetical protein n=1 Tax=Maritalea sp. TaxID=2003361 RepID=UPI003EF575D4
MRQLPGGSYRHLKASTHALFDQFGGQDSASLFTRVSQQTLSKYACFGDDNLERFAPIDIVADIELKLGNPIVTRALAGLSDHLLIKRPIAVSTKGDNARELGVVAKECGEVVSTFAEVVADDHISLNEATRVRKEAMETMAVMAALVEHMDQIIQGAE